jgi:hypothetical protein
MTTTITPWIEIEPKEFVAEDSSFGRATTQRDCPACGKELTMFGYKVIRNSENEITSWERTCNCGTHLVIFND